MKLDNPLPEDLIFDELIHKYNTDNKIRIFYKLLALVILVLSYLYFHEFNSNLENKKLVYGFLALLLIITLFHELMLFSKNQRLSRKIKTLVSSSKLNINKVNEEKLSKVLNQMR